MGMCVNLFVEMNRLVGSCLVCLVKNKNQRRRKVSKKNGEAFFKELERVDKGLKEKINLPLHFHSLRDGVFILFRNTIHFHSPGK